MGRKVTAVLRDLLLALGLGLLLGVVAGVILWALGALAGGVWNGVVVARSGLLLVGGFCLLFAALLLLKGGNLPEDAFHIRLRRRKREDLSGGPPPVPLPKIFRVVHRRFTMLFLAVGILLIAAIPDYLLHISGH